MKNYIYTIVYDFPLKNSDNEHINIVTSSNYEYYINLDAGIRALNKTVDIVKRTIADLNLTIVHESHENVGSPSAFYGIKLKELEKGLGVYLNRLELKD